MTGLTQTFTEIGLMLFALGWIVVIVLSVIIVGKIMRIKTLREGLEDAQAVAAKLGDDCYEIEKSLNQAVDQNLIYEKRIKSYENEMLSRDIQITERDEKIKKLDWEVRSRNLTIESLNNKIELLEAVIGDLQTKLSHKNQPRDAAGHFSGKPKVKKNPDIGKYAFVGIGGVLGAFEEDRCYKRFRSKHVSEESLILIGDDGIRHNVDEYRHCFQLITE